MPLRCSPCHVRRNCPERDEKEHHQADPLKQIAFRKEGSEIDAQGNTESDCRKVVQQKMNVREIERLHASSPARLDVCQQSAARNGTDPKDQRQDCKNLHVTGQGDTVDLRSLEDTVLD